MLEEEESLWLKIAVLVMGALGLVETRADLAAPGSIR